MIWEKVGIPVVDTTALQVMSQSHKLENETKAVQKILYLFKGRRY
jgi:hypothetical protein